MSTLNEKIFAILDDKIHLASTSAMYQMREASNELCKLILQEKIDLLNECISASEHLTETNVSLKISELTSQLKALT